MYKDREASQRSPWKKENRSKPKPIGRGYSLLKYTGVLEPTTLRSNSRQTTAQPTSAAVDMVDTSCGCSVQVLRTQEELVNLDRQKNGRREVRGPAWTPGGPETDEAKMEAGGT